MSTIEWTDRTWNPVTGCTKVSPGCDHCYAEGIARRWAGGKAFPRGFEVTLHPERLDKPLRWQRPAMVFVNSMSDLFHADIPDKFIARVFATMAASPQHTYQVLTKRHGRMRSLLSSPGWPDAVDLALRDLMMAGTISDHACASAARLQDGPLPNVWLGVSAEDQARANLRVPALLDTPAAVRFVSAEPLLGPIDLRLVDSYALVDGGIDWLIIGGESGPGARPIDIEWVRTLVEQSSSNPSTAVFVKQLGSKYGPSKGGDIETFPPDLRVREYPTAVR